MPTTKPDSGYSCDLRHGLPNRTITVAGAERLWRTVAPASQQSLPIDRVEWSAKPGNSWSSTRTVACAIPTAEGPAVSFDDQAPLRLLAVGRSGRGGCNDATPEAESSLLLVEVETGRPLWYYSMREDFDHVAPRLAGVTGPAEVDHLYRIRNEGLLAASIPIVQSHSIVIGSLVALALLGLLTWLGYSKLAVPKLLEHPARRLLYDAIQHNPGIHASRLAQFASRPLSTVRHHLAALGRGGLIIAAKSLRESRYFVKGAVGSPERTRIAALQSPAAQRVHQAVAARPGRSTSEVAGICGVSLPAAMKQLRRLEEVGLVRHERRGRSVVYYLSPASAVVARPTRF